MRKLNYLHRIIVYLFIGIVLASAVSAFDFDNHKEYNPETKTVIITNAFGLGSELGRATLKTESNRKIIPSDYAFEIEFLISEALSNPDITFYDKEGEKLKLIPSPKYNLYYYDPLGVSYETIYQYDNDSNYIGEYQEEIKGKWIKLDRLKDLPIGNPIRVRAYYPDLKEGQTIEWIPELYGIEVEEWAEFTGLTRYEENRESKDNEGYVVKNVIEYKGQLFRVGNSGDNVSFIPQGLAVHLKRDGTGAIATFNIIGINSTNFAPNFTDFKCKVDVDNYGSITTNADGAWYNYTLSGCPVLDAGDAYALHLNTTSTDTTNRIRWMFTTSDTYDGGYYYYDSNSGAPIVYGTQTSYDQIFELWGTESSSAFPNITIDLPANNTITSNTSLIFNCTAEDDHELDNLTFYLNGLANISVIGGVGDTFLNITQNISFANGAYDWYCDCYDNNTQYNITEVRHFIIDTAIPTVSESLNLANTIGELPINSTWNYTASDSNLESCYYNHTDNSTYTILSACNTTINTTWTTAGNKFIQYCANDTYGNEVCNSSIIRVDGFTYTQTDSQDPVGEGLNVTFALTINLTDIETNYANTLANLTINNTIYSSASSTTTQNATILTKTITIPDGWGNSSGILQLWNWTIQFKNDTGTPLIYQTTGTNLTIFNELTSVTSTACPTGTEIVRFFYFQDAQNQTNVTSIDADYNFEYSFDNNNTFTTTGSLTGITNISLCMNTTLYPSYYIHYGEIQYEGSGYSARRFYVYEGEKNFTRVDNILYLLLSGESTSFLFTIQDSDLSVYSNNYITLNRWYPASNDYYVTEMAKTDDKGQSIMKVEVEDVDYRVGVYYRNGTLIYLASPVRLACLASPCSYTLTIPDDSAEGFSHWRGIDYTLVYNETTGVWTFTYSDPSQETDLIRLLTYRDTGTTSVLLCNTSSTGYTGVLTCNVSGYTGVLRAVAIKASSPETPIAIGIYNAVTNALSNSAGVFVTLLIMIPMVLIGVASPILAIVMSIIAIIPAVIFGIVPLAIVMILCAMAFIAIHFMRRGS